MFEKIWAHIRLKRILKALGIKKLTPQQTDAILNKKMGQLWDWKRQSGKTTAAIIFALVWNTGSLYASPHIVSIPDPDLVRVPGSRRFVHRELLEAHKKCTDAGIRVFKIVEKQNKGRWHDERRRMYYWRL